jgi:CRP/FNR family cyclic AMP-dependent transcriptional regulator
MKNPGQEGPLNNINFMECLSSDEKDHLIQISTLKHFRKGQFIFMADELDDSIYVIKKGRVKSFLLYKDGKEIILYIRYPGDVTGITCLCGIRRRTTHLSALEDTYIWVSSAEDFYDFISKRPNLTILIMKIMFARHYQSKILIQDLVTNCAQKRLAKFLLRLVEERGQILYDGHARVPSDLTHEQIAQMIATCRQTTTRLLNAFKDRKYIVKDGHSLVVNTRMLQGFIDN